MATPIINAAKVLGPQLAGKLLGKVDKRFDKFFDNAITKGFSLDQAMGFLVDRFGGSSSGLEKELAGRESQGQLRPDEQAALQGVRGSRLPARVGQAALAYGLPFAMGGQEEPEAVPNQEQPTEKTAAKQSAAPAYDPLAALKKHPELVKFIQKELGSGGNVDSISSKARKQPKLSQIVRSIEEDIEEPFESLLSRLIGQQRQTQQSTQKQGPSPAMSEFMEAMQQFKNMMAGRQNG